MEFFDRENYMRNIYAEFKRTDKFYEMFREDFMQEIKLVINDFFPEIMINKDLEANLKLYAEEMISTAESVIYKDSHYPTYKLAEELKIMTRLVVKEPEVNQDPVFIEKIHERAKEMIVKHYESIVDLSANGFRLLEKYARMYNWEFITNFYGNNGI